MNLSRRDFLRASSMVAAAFGLQAVGETEASAIESDRGLVWLQAQGCTGCSMSLLNSLTSGTSESLLREGAALRFHPTLMASAGPNAVAEAVGARDRGRYVLVVEGAIPTASDGRYCYLWPGMTAWAGVREFAMSAEYVIAVGTCAAFGGIPASKPPHGANPTGARGVSKVVSEKTVINVPGCPPHPDWIMGTIATMLTGEVPKTDSRGRPLAYFSNTVHNRCPYEDSFAEEFCLEDSGCKGSVAHGNCPVVMWNGLQSGAKGVNWCVGARSPCHGCTHPGFPDAMMPFHQEVKD